MAKAKLKNSENDSSVKDFIESVTDEQKKEDSYKLLEIMQEMTGDPPKMWGSSIIGFGNVHLKYASGRELDWMKIGFSPRKAAISLYLNCDIEKQKKQLDKLGPHKHGKGCLYVKRLSDINEGVLREMIQWNLDDGGGFKK